MFSTAQASMQLNNLNINGDNNMQMANISTKHTTGGSPNEDNVHTSALQMMAPAATISKYAAVKPHCQIHWLGLCAATHAVRVSSSLSPAALVP
jgi:hypothetical protein